MKTQITWTAVVFLWQGVPWINIQKQDLLTALSLLWDEAQLSAKCIKRQRTMTERPSICLDFSANGCLVLTQ